MARDARPHGEAFGPVAFERGDAALPRPDAGTMRVHHERIHVRTLERLQFVDLTERVEEVVRHSGIQAGIVNVQAAHTTAAIAVNENEPLLLEDMKDALERLAPREAGYRHDDFEVRTVNLQPGEQPNGHSHCKALGLRASETLNVAAGRIQLGRWQRVFLVELDRPLERAVSILAMGL